MSRISIAEVRAFQEALQKANATMRARIQAVQASAFRYSADYFLDGQAIQASQYYFRETYQTVGGSLLEILDTSEALLERYLNDFSTQVDDSKTAKVNAELLGVAVEKAQRIRQKQEALQASLSSQTGPSQEGRVQQLRLDLVEAVEEEKILENYLQFEQSHTHFFQELLALVMTAQRTMRQLLQEVEFNAQTGTYTYPKGYTQSMDALKQRLNTVRGVDPKRVEALKAYQVLAVVYYDAEGKPQVMWLLEQNGVGVHDPKLKKYLDKAGKYLDPSDYQIITNEDLNKKITESWKTGTYYMDGTQYTGMAGGTLRASAYVESVKGTLDESGLMDVVMGLGLSTAAIRGSMTYEGASGNVVNIPKRPSWQQSEVDAGEMFPNYSSQKSFLDGDEVSHGTKGSSRPEYYTSGHSVEVKNYTIETSAGRSNLANNVSKQVNQRIDNLPQGTKQTIIIDVRGQNYSISTLDDILSRISEKVLVPVEIRFME
ncbi:T7SS effector LXG polymorphic toxin [Listeria sp. ILCC796]|uniref:T7SS effector LXG polymorphic toxin n=1 Tax=Listeria sp. ILCC796 TaxID=1918332 RepID=UPI000B593EBD|nr:T7SS effector LXG polymorphic toxin [Listeria sp. ILCC796]